MTFKCLFSLVRGVKGLSHDNLLLKNCSVSSHLEKGENVSKINLSCAASKIGLKSLGLRQKGVFDILIGSRSSILSKKEQSKFYSLSFNWSLFCSSTFDDGLKKECLVKV